jgi:hypothetical protein
MPEGSLGWLPPDVIGRTGILDRRYAEAIAVGKRNDLGLVEKNRAPGLDRQHTVLGPLHVFDGGVTDCGDAERDVLLGFGHIDQGPAAGLKDGRAWPALAFLARRFRRHRAAG